jgi:peptidyl-dipeptidase A
MSISQLTVAAAVLLFAASCNAATPAAEKANGARAKRFIKYYESTVRPLEIEAALAFWEANLTGKEEDFKKKQAAEEKIDICLSDPERFAELKTIRQGGLSDPIAARQIEVLYLGYLSKQVAPELLKQMLIKSNAVERAFNVFRPEVEGKKLTDNDVRRILRESRDSAERRAAWEAGKNVGSNVVADLLELVALRNTAARKLGFENYYVMRLYCGEQSQEQVLAIFDQLDELTREPFRKAKAEIDAALAKRYGISMGDLQPWHYHDPFFQEVPAVLGELPDAVYKQLDPLKVCRQFYDGIGLPVDSVLARSSLYEMPGKNPHAFSIDINRDGDVRILENVIPGREWLGTTLHELGHAVYSENVGQSLPFLLHTDAHPLCTEGVAMMFGRLAQNVDWLRAMGAVIPDPDQFRAAAARLQRNSLLVFARYCQVMFRFEMELYGNPKQDLNRLWWDLVEKYQEIKRPAGRNEPDYASKYHFIGAPAYYHNYMLGEMFASQVHHALIRAVLPGTKPAGAIYVGNKAAGEFMKQRVFAPGLSVKWNALTEHATGEPLSPKAFAEDLIAE